MNRLLVLIALPLALLSCRAADSVRAEVKLVIDGQHHDYDTARATVDHSAGSDRPSAYLLRDKGQDGLPYLNFRQYQGNPVARFWLRYRPAGQTDDDLARFTCFVPGTLGDGRATLGWKKDDGSARDRTETGDPECRVSTSVEGKRLHLQFEARMQPDKGASGATTGDEKPAPSPQIAGEAWVSIP